MNPKASAVALIAVVAMAAGTVWAHAPAGSTGQCKDNTYTSADSKRGACRGHGGVKDWYAAEKAAAPTGSKETTAATSKANASPNKSAATEAPASKPAAKTTAVRTEPAPGGGAGKVWVNTATHVYHCEGTKWYGKTKAGEYMSEAEAKAKNAHADHGKACA
jgi:hypothetical protein